MSSVSARGPRALASVALLVAGLVAAPRGADAAADPAPVAEARERAKGLLEAGQREEAVAVLRAAAETYPTSPTLWADIGAAELARGRAEAAALAYETSLKADPKQPLVRYNFAYVLRQSGRLDEAVAAYEAFLEAKPNDADAWFGLAQTHEARDAPAAAAAAYERYAETEERPEQSKWVKVAKDKAAELRASAAAQPAATPTSEVETETAGAPEPPVASASAPESPPSSGAAGASSERAAPEPRSASAGASARSTPSARAPSAGRGASFDAALADLRAGRYDAALDALESLAPELTESDYAVLAARAGAHLGRYEAGEAARLYRQALTSAPDAAVPGLLVGLAEARRVDGASDEARALYERALAHPAIDDGLAATARDRLARR